MPTNPNCDDFRCMRDGKQLALLKQKERTSLEAINLCNGKKNHALLLIHGFSSTPAVFREFQSLFSLYDAVLVPTLAGHAANLQAFDTAKAEEWLQSVEGACANLIQNYQQVDVIGLSLGGVLACHLSARFALNHLYLLAPALDLHLAIKPIMWLSKCLKWLGFQRVRNLAGNIHTPNHCEIAYRQLPLSSIIEILDLIHTFEFAPPTCRTDLFLGKHDAVVASDEVAARFANNPKTTVHWLDHSAHVLPLDGDIASILACVKMNK